MWLDTIRSELCEHVFNSSFQKNWDVHWCNEIKILLDGDDMDLELFSERIREIFLSASGGNRAPEQAGLQWRKFLWCILSILSTADNELVILGKPMMKRIVPKLIVEKLSISIGDKPGLTHNPEFIILNLDNPLLKEEEINANNFKVLLEKNPELVRDITVVWSKTNFNDTIQQPMLWAKLGMLKSSEFAYNIKHAWVTVPSQKPEIFRPNTTPFHRAHIFDGGSYWGIGKQEVFGMSSILDMISNWRDRIPILQSSDVIEKSIFYSNLGLK